MVIELGLTLDMLQTVAILFTLIFTLWQWTQSTEIVKTDNLSKIISALNDLRSIRIQNPQLERALFENRKGMTDNEIMVRVYNVQFANIFEWVFLSYKRGLLNEKEWKDWSWIWKYVILKEESMRKVMLDKTIYTFCFDAHKEIEKLVEELKKEGYPIQKV
jgi:hypothetical protein